MTWVDITSGMMCGLGLACFTFFFVYFVRAAYRSFLN